MDMKVGDQEVFDHCCEATGVNVGSLYPSILILTLILELGTLDCCAWAYLRGTPAQTGLYALPDFEVGCTAPGRPNGSAAASLRFAPWAKRRRAGITAHWQIGDRRLRFVLEVYLPDYMSSLLSLPPTHARGGPVGVKIYRSMVLSVLR